MIGVVVVYLVVVVGVGVVKITTVAFVVS